MAWGVGRMKTERHAGKGPAFTTISSKGERQTTYRYAISFLTKYGRIQRPMERRERTEDRLQGDLISLI
jgi:hypothetical protein